MEAFNPTDKFSPNSGFSINNEINSKNGYNPNVTHIVYTSDDRFAEILGVSLVSLFENNKDMEEINVYILDSGITEDNKHKLISVCKSYKRNGVFIPATDISKKMSMHITIDRGSLSQYARLFVSSDLTEDLSRVLYFDCDIVVRKSIRELWNLDLHDKTIGALMDAFSKYYRVNIDLEENDIMFNSGVMLIDLNKWKEQKVEERLLNFIKAKNGVIQQGDQGALNHVLSHDTYCFEPRFNSVTIFHDFSYKKMLNYRKPPKFYEEKSIKEAVENPTIVHFTTSFLSKRAWMKGCEHKYVGEWLKYKEMSPWKDTELWDDNRPQWKQRCIKIYKKLPEGLAVKFAGFIQVYCRPFMNMLKTKRMKKL